MMPRHHQSDRPRIREAARQHVDSPGRRRMTPAEIAARKAEREKRKRETPSMLSRAPDRARTAGDERTASAYRQPSK